MGKRSRRGREALTQRASVIAPAGPSPLQRGRQLQASGQFAAAEAVYRGLLAENPEHAEGHHLLGVLSLQMGRADAAVELISRSLTLRPGNAQAHANLGSALVGLKRPQEALEHYERALQIDPAFVAVQHNRANTLLLIGRHDVVTRVRAGRRVDRPFSFLSVSSDEFVIPPDRQGFYAEKVVYLPDTFQANDHRSHLTERRAPGRQAAGLPDSGLVFCCFNNTYKLNPAVFDVWMRVMNAVPDSVLWLVAGDSAMQARVCQEAASRGVIPERLIFAPRVPYEEHLARLPSADLFLDTLPFNAGATAGDALWASVPVLTCTGDAFASRMAGSLLRSFGISELVASSLEQYERTAVDLSFDRERLAGYKLRLAAQRATAPLFDSGRFCRNLEAAYETMWDRTQRGEPPISFAVQCAAGRR